MLAVPTVAALAVFTGRSPASFTVFADEALTQATLVFTLVTKRNAYPDDADQHQLALNAIMALADRIYLEAPYATAKASPFSAETIGSYSYSKGSTAYLAASGGSTGLWWWDLAIDELSLVDRSVVTYGSISVLQPDVFIETTTGKFFILGPGDHVPAAGFERATAIEP